MLQNPGFIYFATNESMPGIVKIGCSKHPRVRCQQLSCTTSIPEPFHLQFWQFVLDMERMEQTLHRMLDHCRVSPDREFFRIEVAQAIKVFSAWASELGLIPIRGIDFEIDANGVIDPLHANGIPLRHAPLTDNALIPAVRFSLMGVDSEIIQKCGYDPTRAAERLAREFHACGGAL